MSLWKFEDELLARTSWIILVQLDMLLVLALVTYSYHAGVALVRASVPRNAARIPHNGTTREAGKWKCMILAESRMGKAK